jgi:NADH:ubiquinone oxidoreductase subunit D
MEAMIYHFKLIMDGIQVPAGERYDMVEGANGELGFYVVSDGGGKPYRIKCGRPASRSSRPSRKLVNGGSISDSIATLGGLNIIAGELER